MRVLLVEDDRCLAQSLCVILVEVGALSREPRTIRRLDRGQI